MLLVILHGFGDGKKALGELAGKIHLPGVACLVARGEHRLPGEILPAEPRAPEAAPLFITG
ncbi:hypothetical protein Pmar_PMAR018708 [Perkinsus marinus ATCC 50983]|uniref:Phospholipase/carboxylesterase/thioesterase domain-containing protein n=1 Tax=Perkinsus marinus (strain ATCC 50983 / TXsc) TaxID=423536 RepID=C5K909_PERM5|nr:hypothetical protein Pmar_PMAR018708 [Perkinsus marinus ATCC 50983]EER19032.1 hypothetical protein Pmar_PMAR018708 [Perkinsus marinus ATCC 50983]|eukprot:XP_002787236.1 hypothetical protein Pmar_PMAR018708 [Perkinsus marinus ATCC 50983]